MWYSRRVATDGDANTKHLLKMFTLTDTFNNRTISTHRTLNAAVKAQAKHSRAVKRHNGSASYIPTAITENGKPVDEYEMMQAERRVEA